MRYTRCINLEWLTRAAPRSVVIAALLTLSPGCAPEHLMPLAAWQLETTQGAPTEVVLPFHVRHLATPTRYRLSRLVEVPVAWRGCDLTVTLPAFEGAANLFVDGEPVLPSLADNGGRHHGVYRWRLEPARTQRAVLQLTLQVDHTTLQSGRVDTVPLLGPSDVEPAQARWVEWVNVYATGVALAVILQVALTYLVLARSQRTYLWLGLELLFSSAMPLDTLGILSQLGGWDTPVLGMSLAAASCFSVHFLHAQFGLPAPSPLWRYSFYGVVGLVFLFIGLDPSSHMLERATMAYIFGASVRNVVVCWRLVRGPSPPATAALVAGCWLLMLALSAPDLGAWAGFGEVALGMRPSGVGLGMFALLQSFILLYAHLQSLKRSAQLADALRAANEELRRQIGDRSRQLYNALALTGHAPARMPGLSMGQVVQGRYRVLRQLGEGGMGYVYEVQRLADGKRMALKVAQGMDGASLARLAREANLASLVSHPNVVSLHDVDVADAGFVYVVMELVDGVSLHACKQQFVGRVDLGLSIAAQLAEGLQALHRVHIVHRDLKPANALLTYPTAHGGLPQVKIVDFGISRNVTLDAQAHPLLHSTPLVHERIFSTADPDAGISEDLLVPQATLFVSAGSTPSTSQSGHVPGTPRYMGPELVDGDQALLPAADVFSLGLMTYELLSGRYPFSEPPVLTRLRGRDPRPPLPLPEAVLGKLPSLVAASVMQCLALDPNERPSPAALAGLWRR